MRWTDRLLHRYRVEKNISEGYLYDVARLMATMMDRVLNRQSSLMKSTRIRKPRGKGKMHTSHVDKQSLQSTFEFGHFLADLCSALTIEATKGPLPVRIPLRTGQVLEQWSGLPHPDKLAVRRTKYQIEASMETRAAWEADGTLRTRYSLVNLRIEAEMLMFIAQTGMNLQQAHTLRMDQFHYTSHLDGYQVRSYKNRRQGEVLFEIFANYREWFDRYLTWRTEWFPNEPKGLLFPLIRSGGRIKEEAPQFVRISGMCKSIEIKLVRPRLLRGTRVNWLLRESRNPEQVAELAQHTTETLIRVYADPHPQAAMVEITRFHQQTDPTISPPTPGHCVSAEPKPLLDIPKHAPLPDCVSTSGCLFCVNHRDIESEDHVWSLSSLRHLKSLELARYRPPASAKVINDQHPALLAIERLTAKLRFFEEHSEVHKLWVDEARERINEENYHPAWDGFIRLAVLQ
ncbi:MULTISPECIES: hypothetical protein [unclassified Methylophaga]|uniref:hypothetical protein n=1 Tax=unclassified Methylophaga TaxID=2629249 RepID=UPI002353E456|nr:MULTISPECIES: hypothetical protein [unclassified Methylophaga]